MRGSLAYTRPAASRVPPFWPRLLRALAVALERLWRGPASAAPPQAASAAALRPDLPHYLASPPAH